MKLGLENKVVLVSGGSSGIGKACARDFAKEGCKVMITARREGPLQDTVKELEALGVKAAYTSADMTVEADVNAVVAKTTELFGAPDVVVCNVRSLIKFGFDDATPDDFRTSMEQCVMSVVYLTKACLPAWKEKGWGRFINLGSVCTLEPHRWHHIVLGNTMRLAAVGLMRSLSNEYSHLNSLFEKIEEDGNQQARPLIEPQPKISMGRAGTPEELSAQVVFLASERASYITGRNVVIDGGWTRGL